MSVIYLLFHRHELISAIADEKLIGAYATRADGESAIARVFPEPGFCDSPDGFLVEELEVDLNAWSTGFFPSESDVVAVDVSVLRKHTGEKSDLRCAFLAYHEYEFPLGVDHPRVIGVFSSEALAQDAIAYCSLLPGFSQFADGFTIGLYEVGKDQWTEGYVTLA
jgi:hypothetical protein